MRKFARKISETMTLRIFLGWMAALLLLTGCRNAQQPQQTTLWVTIAPLRSLVQAITGDDFAVEVLVPPSASPETFEPTPRQYGTLTRSPLIFGTGLIDFERQLLERLEHPECIVNLSEGIDLIAGSCSHAHAGHDDAEEAEHAGGTEHTEHAEHAHGVDPHIWTSPRELQRMAANAYRAIHAQWPDSMRYTANYEALCRRIAEVDSLVARRLSGVQRRWFLIYHPALTYYARAYGLRQVAVEEDGKEPSARRLAALIDSARRDGVRTVFYQAQFPASSVEVIAEDIAGRAVRIDPLAEQVLDNILVITDELSKQ